ncbi:MAG TPA: Imm63 family immunity protein [Blastocatellia bacterium]|nr:Imm63 family immunity protein [Blastocatellia bacterium]
MYSLDEIEYEVERLAAVIGASARALPTFGRSEDGARPHIEVDGSHYHYVVVERGEELRRETTSSLDELLYYVFEAVTFSMAMNYEAAHRVESQDCRRLIFRRQIELLSQLSPEWAETESRDHDRILREHPFDDLALVRATLCEQLRRQGISADEAWRAACERRPLPKM